MTVALHLAHVNFDWGEGMTDFWQWSNSCELYCIVLVCDVRLLLERLLVAS